MHNRDISLYSSRARSTLAGYNFALSGHPARRSFVSKTIARKNNGTSEVTRATIYAIDKHPGRSNGIRLISERGGRGHQLRMGRASVVYIYLVFMGLDFIVVKSRLETFDLVEPPPRFFRFSFRR